MVGNGTGYTGWEVRNTLDRTPGLEAIDRPGDGRTRAKTRGGNVNRPGRYHRRSSQSRRESWADACASVPRLIRTESAYIRLAQLEPRPCRQGGMLSQDNAGALGRKTIP